MRKIALIIFVCALCAAPCLAQTTEAKVEEIRRIYKEVSDEIARAENSFPESSIYLSELVVNKGGTIYPAVGIFSSTIRFYYTFGDRELNPYPNRLLKIMVTNKRSANTEAYEYLFDKAGRLIFYFEKTDYTDGAESRFYFSSGRAIRILRNQKMVDVNSPVEIKASKSVQAQAAKLVGIFKRSLE